MAKAINKTEPCTLPKLKNMAPSFFKVSVKVNLVIRTLNLCVFYELAIIFNALVAGFSFFYPIRMVAQY
jgi:hypothetical protein